MGSASGASLSHAGPKGPEVRGLVVFTDFLVPFHLLGYPCVLMACLLPIFPFACCLCLLSQLVSASFYIYYMSCQYVMSIYYIDISIVSNQTMLTYIYADVVLDL
jgi:hypothetical protein